MTLSAATKSALEELDMPLLYDLEQAGNTEAIKLYEKLKNLLRL